jgi:hypothetical protein
MAAIYNERTGVELSALFFNVDGPTIPTSASWRLDCQTTGVVLSDWQALNLVTVSGPTGAPVKVYADFSTTAEMNRIVRNSNARETKTVMVSANLGEDNEFNQEYSYVVKNVRGRT